MVSHPWRPVLALAVLVLTVSACASHTPAHLPVAAPAIAQVQPVPVPPPAPAADPIATLIAASQQHFDPAGPGPATRTGSSRSSGASS